MRRNQGGPVHLQTVAGQKNRGIPLWMPRRTGMPAASRSAIRKKERAEINKGRPQGDAPTGTGTGRENGIGAAMRQSQGWPVHFRIVAGQKNRGIPLWMPRRWKTKAPGKKAGASPCGCPDLRTGMARSKRIGDREKRGRPQGDAPTGTPPRARARARAGETEWLGRLCGGKGLAGSFSDRRRSESRGIPLWMPRRTGPPAATDRLTAKRGA